MSPLCKDTDGQWRLDKGALVTQIIVIFVGVVVGGVGSYYGTVAKMGQLEYRMNLQEAKINVLEKAVSEHSVANTGSKIEITYIKERLGEVVGYVQMLPDIRRDLRKTRKEGQ